MSVEVVLVDPNGQDWTAGSAIEVNDLLAQGYRFKGTGQVTSEGGSTPATSAAPAPAPPGSPTGRAVVTNTGDVQKPGGTTGG